MNDSEKIKKSNNNTNNLKKISSSEFKIIPSDLIIEKFSKIDSNYMIASKTIGEGN